MLSNIAYTMRSRRLVAVHERDVEEMIAGEIGSVQTGVGVIDLMTALQSAGLLVRVGDDQVTFFHELIQEYFAAVVVSGEVERLGHVPEAIEQTDPWWEQVLVLAHGMVRDCPGALTALARSNLRLSARFVMDAAQPSANALDVVVTEARSGIGSNEHLAALEALAVVWNEEARHAVASTLRSKVETEGFLRRFASSPYGAAVDLFALAKTAPVVAGVLAVLRKYTGTSAQRVLLGEHLLSRLKGAGDKSELGFDPSQLMCLLGEISQTPEIREQLRFEIKRLFEGPIALRLERFVLPRSVPPLVDDEWRVGVARAALAGDLETLSRSCTDASPENLKWLKPLLLALDSSLEGDPQKDCQAILGLIDGGTSEAHSGAGRSQDAGNQHLDVPSTERWNSMTADERERWHRSAPNDQRLISQLRDWPAAVRSDFREYAIESIPEKQLPLSPDSWQAIDLPDGGKSLALARIQDMAASGRRGEAAELATKWKLSVPGVIALPRAGWMPPRNPEERDDLERRFLLDIRAGRIDQVLGATHRLRDELAPAAGLAAGELIDSGQPIGAAQLIVAFRLEAEFRDRLSSLVGVLVAAGKTGLAQQLGSKAGTAASQVDQAMRDRVRSHVARRDWHAAADAVQSGFGYLDAEIRGPLSSELIAFAAQRDEAGLMRLVEDRRIYKFLDRDLILRAIAEADLLIHCTVFQVEPNQVIGAVRILGTFECPYVSGLSRRQHLLAHLAGHDSTWAIDRLWVAPKGCNLLVPRKTLAAQREVVIARDESRRTFGSDVDALELLRRKWGARLKRTDTASPDVGPGQ